MEKERIAIYIAIGVCGILCFVFCGYLLEEHWFIAMSLFFFGVVCTFGSFLLAASE
jgi:hypothetical protein